MTLLKVMQVERIDKELFLNNLVKENKCGKF